MSPQKRAGTEENRELERPRRRLREPDYTVTGCDQPTCDLPLDPPTNHSVPEIAAFHPQIVHFVIALFIVGVVFRLLSLSGRWTWLNPAATTLPTALSI